MEEPIVEKNTTYYDNKDRWWVVTGFWYNDTEKPEAPTHVSIYRVGSNNEFEYLELSLFKLFIQDRLFVLVTKPLSSRRR